jgi:uncharacterized protein
MNGTDTEKLLSEAKTIAIVGLSADKNKDSHLVAKFLQSKGYRIIPVNPKETEILGEKSYPDLASIPYPVDIVDVFRRSEFLPPIAEEAVRIKAKVLWMQLGIENEQAAEIARKGGLIVIQNTCIAQEHGRVMR